MVQARGQALAERFVWPLGVVALPEPVEPPLLSGERAPWRPRGLGLERLVHALVPPVLLRMRGSISSGRMPSCTHHTDSVESRPRAFEANGAPLSVRIRSGRP